MRRIIDKWTDDEIRQFAQESKTRSELAKKIGYANYAGSNSQIISNKLKELGLEMPEAQKAHNWTNEEIFIENSPVSHKVMRERYKKLYPEKECAICHCDTQWQGKYLQLRLDHINGDHFDNRLENLRWICPNCDSQLPTFCSRNSK